MKLNRMGGGGAVGQCHGFLTEVQSRRNLKAVDQSPVPEPLQKGTPLLRVELVRVRVPV